MCDDVERVKCTRRYSACSSITIIFLERPPARGNRWSTCTHPHYHEQEHHVHAQYQNGRALIKPVVRMRHHPRTMLAKCNFLWTSVVTFITGNWANTHCRWTSWDGNAVEFFFLRFVTRIFWLIYLLVWEMSGEKGNVFSETHSSRI